MSIREVEAELSAACEDIEKRRNELRAAELKRDEINLRLARARAGKISHAINRLSGVDGLGEEYKRVFEERIRAELIKQTDGHSISPSDS